MWALITLWVGISAAQDTVRGGESPSLNAQLFAPSIDAHDTLWSDDSLRAESGTSSASLALQYVHEPLLYLDGLGDPHPVVSGLWQMSVQGAHTRGPLRLGADLPVYLRSLGSEGAETGLGDFALDAKLTALSADDKPLGLALSGRLSLPTATVQAPLGTEGVGWTLGVIGDTTLGERVHAAVNLGVRLVPLTVLENLDYGNQVYWRVGLGVALTDTAGLSLDVVQHLSWTERSEASRPLEALLGGSYRLFNQNLVVRGGLGAGLNQGIGAPRFRAVLSVSWERPPKDRDSDGDGLLDSLDACVWAPEDMDGIADGDGCPEPTRITVRVVDANGEELLDGGWKAGRSSGPSGEAFDQLDGTVVIDGWGPQHFTETVEIGVSGEVQLVTITLTPIPGVLAVIGRDPAGVLIEGITWGVQNTAHGDLVAGDPVEMLPGAYELYVDAPGYRREWVEVLVTVDTDDIVEVTLTSSMAQVRVDRIAITESVYFQPGKAIILSRSYALLDDVAAALEAYPELQRIRVEGHTDDQGSIGENQVLSEDRAAAIVAYLVHTGIDPSRVEARGYGQSRPIDTNETEEGRANNRRVDFMVVERSGDIRDKAD